MRSDAVTDDLAALAPEALAPRNGRRELLLRVASAVVLAPLGLWAAYSGGLFLQVATGLCGVVAAVEWVRMSVRPLNSWLRPVLYAVLAITSLAAVLLASRGIEYVALACLAGCAAASAAAAVGRSGVSSIAFGAVYTSLPFGAFVWIREAAPDGQLFLMAVLVIVWTNDTAAFFAGRGFGGPLLSPKDSPNKTWTGAIGALVCAGLAGAAVARAGGSDFLHWLLAGFLISVVAQGGDLLESRFKRFYGVKDTSGLVPGHGGVLDRLDALMAVVVVVALVVRFAPVLVPGLGSAGAG